MSAPGPKQTRLPSGHPFWGIIIPYVFLDLKEPCVSRTCPWPVGTAAHVCQIRDSGIFDLFHTAASPPLWLTPIFNKWSSNYFQPWENTFRSVYVKFEIILRYNRTVIYQLSLCIKWAVYFLCLTGDSYAAIVTHTHNGEELCEISFWGGKGGTIPVVSRVFSVLGQREQFLLCAAHWPVSGEDLLLEIWRQKSEWN